jgi:hypothetical protein
VFWDQVEGLGALDRGAVHAMHFLTRAASKLLRTTKGKAEWARRWAEYEKHFASIKSSLTANWRRVGETEFHDAVVWSVERPRKAELILRVDMNPCWQQPPWKVCTLHFTGVRDAVIPDRVTHDCWLYHEIGRAADGCGELRVLLHESELWIASRDLDFTANYDHAA